ncbi:unnamed protein product, partial [Coccothraustes coccothraustes]
PHSGMSPTGSRRASIQSHGALKERELLFPQQVTPDLLQPPERQDCTNMSKQ